MPLNALEVGEWPTAERLEHTLKGLCAQIWYVKRPVALASLSQFAMCWSFSGLFFRVEWGSRFSHED